MTEREWKINKAASCASRYNKEKLYPTFKSCMWAAANTFNLHFRDVQEECTRRWKAKASKKAA